MLAVEVEFLTGRFVATAYSSRLESEWPPHPARVFSALVATHFEHEPVEPEEHAVLEWIETLGPPAIRASEAAGREVVTVYVPVNDLTVVGDFDNEVDAVHAAEEALNVARARNGAGKAIAGAKRSLKKAELRLATSIAKSISVPIKASKEGPSVASRVLPEARIRQPRTFPSVTPELPQVTYVWPDAEPTPTQRTSLDGLLARVVRLGHSSSFVSLRLVEGDRVPTLWPEHSGELTLRVVSPGQVRSLESYWALHRETQPRVMPSTPQGYTRTPPAVRKHAPTTVFSDDWLVFRRTDGPVLPIVATAGLASTFRRALMSHADEPIPEFITGHRDSGGPSERDHMAVVPLSFVGRQHATGAIIGLALLLPRRASDGERAALYRAVANWEGKARQDDEDTPGLSIHLGSAGTMTVERVEWGTTPRTLRPGAWCKPARVWLSVTPVALDRNPGDLRSRDATKLGRALSEATESLAGACQRIGLPRPIGIEVLPAAPLAGAAKAQRFPAFPEVSEKIRRVLTHARLEFAEPVRGPILLGAGRYLGLGLFRPEASNG